MGNGGEAYLNDQDLEYSYRVLRRKDESAVKSLTKSSFSGFLDGDYWDWKYNRNPNFDPSLVIVAEKDGKIVGCNHWLIRDLKFSNKLVIRSALGADITVKSEHRKRGIGKSLLLFLRSSKAFKEKKAVISYMFPNPEMINPLYRPSAFYIPAPRKTTRYMKILNWNKLKKRLATINRHITSNEQLQERVSNVDLNLLLKIGEAPPLFVRIHDKQIEIAEYARATLDKVNVFIRTDLTTLESLKRAKHKTCRLLEVWFKGKLKIQGKLSSLIKLSRNSWLFHEVFS